MRTPASRLDAVRRIQSGPSPRLNFSGDVGIDTDDTLLYYVSGATVYALRGISTTASGNPTLKLTASLAGDVALNNTANYFDGPSVAQGTSGVWFVSGTVSLFDGTAAGRYTAQLWDGTSLIASSRMDASAAGEPISISLSGYISAPAGDLRISVREQNATTGNILAATTTTALAKASTITAIRIA